MNPGKQLTYIIGMFALGAVFFALFAWLVEYRQGRSIDAPASHTREPRTEDPLSVLAGGARAAGDTAIAELRRGSRSKAVHALDAAMRALEVGQHAARGNPQFQLALTSIKSARHSLQNGNPAMAAKILHKALAALDPARASGPETPPAFVNWSDYDGATLINAQGVRIGKLATVKKSAEGSLESVIVIGGNQNVFGLFDFGGERLIVPADRLVFGKAQVIGPVMVSLPTYETTAASIEQDLRYAHR